MLKFFFILIIGFILGAVVIENKQYFSQQIPIPVAFLPDGGEYEGDLKKGALHGEGRIAWPSGDYYEGEFRHGLYQGKGRYKTELFEYQGDFDQGNATGIGKIIFADGSVYEGQVVNFFAQGFGHYESEEGEYSGAFSKNLFEGEGIWNHVNGEQYEGEFKAGLYEGQGKLKDSNGVIYSGEFVAGKLTGLGELTSDDLTYKGGFKFGRFDGKGEYRSVMESYKGEFKEGAFHGEGEYQTTEGLLYLGDFENDRFHGQGILTLPDGEKYEGSFENGFKHGAGVLTYPNPVDGVAQVKGEWSYGQLVAGDSPQVEYNPANIVEDVLYQQPSRVQGQLEKLLPQDPNRKDMYFVGIGGDGSQGVFRREVNFVKELFEKEFLTTGRSVSLVNSVYKPSFENIPLATLTSIEQTLMSVAEKMDPEDDLLFLFLTSHGSADFHFYLNQPGISLSSLSAEVLGDLVSKLPVKHKVIVISACYAGGYVTHVKDDTTMVVVAASEDKTSFGCYDSSEMTYFGEAFFKDAIPVSASFEEAFERTRDIVRGREASQDYEQSNPLIFKPKAILAYLAEWREQLAEEKHQRALNIE